MNETVNIYKDVKSLNEDFTSLLKSELEVKENVNIALSGGSTPKALFEYWAECYRNTIDWQRIAFFWGDERCVVPEDPMSNYGMTKQLLFDNVPKIDKQKIHRIHGENIVEEELVWYKNIMDKYLPKQNGIPSLDIMMLGLGDDGHTVSIFPDHIELWDSAYNCVEAAHPESKMPRITITGRVVNNAKSVVFLVTGKSKAEKVKQIIEERDKYYDIYPAARVAPENGHLYWFLDQEAASMLTNVG